MAERRLIKGEIWQKDFTAACLLLLFAVLVNRGIEIKGLYMDDLYLWSCYGEQSIFQYVFPIGSTRFRFLYYLAAWLEFALIGTHVEWIVPVNIILNALVAFTVYKMACVFSRSSYIGTLCGLAFLASRMAYYQIAQAYGLMETLALWLAIMILYLLYQYLNGSGEKRPACFFVCCGLYFAICFVHERYMVLLPLLLLALAFVKCRDLRQWMAAAGTFVLVQLIRVLATGRLLPAGTGKTEVAKTFSLKEGIRYALSQAAYVFGINAGPGYLNGQSFLDAPLWVVMLIAVADLMLAAVVIAFIARLFHGFTTKTGSNSLASCFLFLGFIVGCIVCSSVTIRVEMRWVYVSYTASLLFLSWMYGFLTKDMDRHSARFVLAIPFAAMITAYVVLMFPVEVYYRGMYPNLYFWSAQQQYNSLAEVTYRTYGDEIFGKRIYILGNQYKMSDFTAETFFKVFDRKRMAEGTQVRHIADVREIGLVDDDMLVLQEDPERNRYLDITLPTRILKCRGQYGYYSDGWIDEVAEIQVMAGQTGEIRMNFYYPGEITGDEWIIVYVNGDAKKYLVMDSQQMETSVTTQPYKTVTLKFKTNFYVQDAKEQRGTDRLAAVLKMTAD